jgi:acyl dehydratase
VVARFAAPPVALVRDYLHNVGGDAASYRGVVPPHLFPQWGLAAAGLALGRVNVPVERVLNAGCRLEVRRPLPAGTELSVRARVERFEQDERRAVIEVRIVTGTVASPDCLVATVVGVIPTGRGSGRRKEPVRVAQDAREIGFWRLGRGAGFEYALLTGDLNPLHWLGPYARAAGHRGPVLHGFATMARAWEGVVRARLAGAAERVRGMDVRFTRALVLPAKVGLYLGPGGSICVGDAPGGPAYLAGTITLDEEDWMERSTP